MPRTLRELEVEALQLPLEARDQLAARLLKSVESEHQATPRQTESKWAALARRYRENPNLRERSEQVNALVHEFREEFAL